MQSCFLLFFFFYYVKKSRFCCTTHISLPWSPAAWLMISSEIRQTLWSDMADSCRRCQAEQSPGGRRTARFGVSVIWPECRIEIKCHRRVHVKQGPKSESNMLGATRARQERVWERRAAESERDTSHLFTQRCCCGEEAEVEQLPLLLESLMKASLKSHQSFPKGVNKWFWFWLNVEKKKWVFWNGWQEHLNAAEVWRFSKLWKKQQFQVFLFLSSLKKKFKEKCRMKRQLFNFCCHTHTSL